MNETTTHLRKTEKVQLENMLSEYFRTRLFYPYGEIGGNRLPTFTQNNHARQKHKSLQTSTFEFKTYCSMTSLHGFIHFKENSFNKIGKLIWAIFLLAIYTLCFVAVYMLIFMFREMPAIISLDNTVSSIRNIPFPAVTVCSSNKVRPSVYNYPDINNTDYDDQLIQNTLHNICEKNSMKKNLKLSVEFLDSFFVTQVLKEIIVLCQQNLSFPCGEIIKEFHWLHLPEKDSCNIWFQETFTSYGLCYSFNMMPMGDLLTGVDEWSQEDNHGWKNYQSSWKPDTGYHSNDIPITHLPMRTFGDTEYHSAAMILDLHNKDFNYECSQGLEIFYILIHSPAEWPDVSHPTILASPNTLETIAVEPIVLTTSQELTSWDPVMRHCYFQNERKLRFFKVYTKNNCMLECQNSHILEQCGCIPFYHLRIKNTPICGPAKMTCWVTASQSSSDSCNCLPDCSELSFKTSKMVAHYNKMKQLNNLSMPMSSATCISIFYQNKNYIGLDRIMTFNFGQFMGEVGGIMGLCLGFSFLSLAEIIYFSTLRPLVNYYNTKRKTKKVNPTRISENNLELTNNGENQYYT